MNKRIYINNDWGFSREFNLKMCEKYFDDTYLDKVRLPHTNIETPFNYFDEECYQMICGYRKILYIDEKYKDKMVLLTFEGIAHESTLYVNGKEVYVHKCGYTAFTINISPYIFIGNENVLTLKVNSNENLNIPPFGNVIDYMTYGGIYREAYIELKENTYIEDIFIVTTNVCEKEKNKYRDKNKKF